MELNLRNKTIAKIALMWWRAWDLCTVLLLRWLAVIEFEIALERLFVLKCVWDSVFASFGNHHRERWLCTCETRGGLGSLICYARE